MPERLLVRTGSGSFWMKEFTESCQIGIVIIQDDVEIGANVTIDRGALGPTVIGKGSKFDNLSRVDTTWRIGERMCMIVSQTGLRAAPSSASTWCCRAVGLAGHLTLGNRCVSRLNRV